MPQSYLLPIMRPLAAVAMAVACCWPVAAETTTPAALAADMVDAARQSALEDLLSERGPAKDFERAVNDARAAGVSAQAILEARFLYQVDKGNDAAVAAMLPDFLKQQADFKLEDSAIFSVAEDWLAVIEYVRSLAALEAGDRAGFKQHITEAFWLSPRQAAAFAPHIERLRMEEAMRDVKVDFSGRVTSVFDEAEFPLADLLAGKKAMLLHFWSPWSRECEAAMPEFTALAALLAKHEIAVASLMPGDVPALLDDAKEMVRPLEGAGAWLADPKGGTFSRLLRVQNLPTMVLLSLDGAVLFNGDPSDKALWTALHKLDDRITRPERPSPDGP